MCTFWYVEALAWAGRSEEAQLIFEKMLTYANHLGPTPRRLGPQARRWATFRKPSPPRSHQRRFQSRSSAGLTT